MSTYFVKCTSSPVSGAFYKVSLHLQQPEKQIKITEPHGALGQLTPSISTGLLAYSSNKKIIFHMIIICFAVSQHLQTDHPVTYLSVYVNLGLKQ